MAVLQKVKINNEWVPVSGSNVNSGGGITEEKEVYIGEEEPTDDGAKLWIDTDDESGESGEGSSGENGGGNGGNKPIVIYCPIDKTFGDGHKETNATNVALLTEDFNKGELHSNILIALTMEGVIRGCAHSIMHDFLTGVLRIVFSMSAAGDTSNYMTLIANTLSVDANGDIVAFT